MFKANYFYKFIFLMLANTLFVIGVVNPEASDGEEEQNILRISSSRRRLRGFSECMSTYLPSVTDYPEERMQAETFYF